MENDKLVRLSDVKTAIGVLALKYDCMICGDVQRCVDSIPAVDAVGVRHGRWEGNYPQAKFRLKRCSACKTICPEGWYCFFCGARMDGEEEHNALD